MRHKLTMGILILGLTIVVLAESDDDSGSIRGLVDGVLKDFNKACADADADYEKKISPVIKRHNLKRVSRIHTAGKDAIRKLNKIAADAQKNDSPVGEVLAKDGVAFVDKVMGESEIPIPIKDVWRMKFEGHRYLAILAPINWEQAAIACKKMGGHLAYIETREEMQFLQKITNGIPMYIGATDKQKDGDWRWLNGRKVNHSLWFANHPVKIKSHYGSALINQGMVSINPSFPSARGFFCEWDQ